MERHRKLVDTGEEIAKATNKPRDADLAGWKWISNILIL